jgi:hypothetical protein
MGAKRTVKSVRRSTSSPAKVTEITKVRRPVVARKTRIVGRTEPATLARAITEPVVWDVEFEAPVSITREQVVASVPRPAKARASRPEQKKKTRRAS